MGGQVNSIEGELSKALLENNKCYLIDCGAEVFVWVGRVTQVEDRKSASQAAEVETYHPFLGVCYMTTYSHLQFFPQEFISSQNRPKSTRITRLIQGYETHSFKSKFDYWPSGAVAGGAEEGRGKVAGNNHFYTLV